MSTRNNAIFIEAVAGLIEYYPCLKDDLLVIRMRSNVYVPDTGNQQDDYEHTRDQVERLAKKFEELT